MDLKDSFQAGLDELDEPIVMEVRDSKRRLKKRIIFISGGVLLFLIFVWWMIGEMIGYTTYSRMQTKCARAHNFANSCIALQEDGTELTTGIWCIKRGSGTFEDGVLRYYSDAEGEWFGLVVDKDGAIVYALNSEVQIPEEYLRHPPVYEEQMELLDSHFAFRRKKAVAVWYTDDSKNTMRD